MYVVPGFAVNLSAAVTAVYVGVIGAATVGSCVAIVAMSVLLVVLGEVVADLVPADLLDVVGGEAVAERVRGPFLAGRVALRQAVAGLVVGRLVRDEVPAGPLVHLDRIRRHVHRNFGQRRMPHRDHARLRFGFA